MFFAGDQGFRNNYPFEDPYKKCAADRNRFNFGCRAENFVIPRTAYAFDDDNNVVNDLDRDDLDDFNLDNLEKDTDKTLVNKVNTALIQTGYDVAVQTTQAGDETAILVSESQAMKPPVAGQKYPEFTKSYMEDVGIVDDEIDLFQSLTSQPHSTDAIPPTPTQYCIKEGTNIMVEKNSQKPILPVTVNFEGNDDSYDLNITNTRGMTPAEAWKSIGLSPPVWTKRNKRGNYVPWPKLGGYGTVKKEGLFVNNHDRLKKLNAGRVGNQMKAINRVETLKRKQNHLGEWIRQRGKPGQLFIS